MEIDPGVQGLQALLSLACGPALGLVYDLMGEVRRRFGLEKLALLGDLLFSLLFACLLFLLGSVAGAGRLRLFMPLGIALGGLVYLTLLRPAGRWISRQAAALLLALAGFLLLPGSLLLGLAEKILKIAKNLFQYWKRWYKISYPQFCPVAEICRLEEHYETQKSGIVTKLIILALAAYALIALVQMKSRVEDAEAERDALRAEAQALAVTNASLNYEISHAGDKETVEKVAREKLGLVLPGEIVFYDISD